ncbi:MAG: 16S rRNA (guanine(966)-N(2))-methyltransferase RsmD [Candidatus Gastranaerophilales bacterium]|nr:16S rRNA (guanine(966)-N(2))-methyltransferase RsmD [Candidatus Gastranaerophilales bacterium]
MQITGGFLNSRKIKTEEYENIKPTLSKTRQGLFNALSGLIEFDQSSFLDMFAGSGIMSFEAISRGFSPVYTFEKDRKTALLIKDNFKSLKLTDNLFFGDSIKLLKKINKSYDVIFIDPPYNSDLYQKSLKTISENDCLNLDGIIILEHPSTKAIDPDGYTLIKEKQYADKMLSFLKK